MSRARVKRTTTIAGRDSYHVHTTTGSQLAVKGEAPHALGVAQRIAERNSEPIVLTVDRKSLFGPSVTLFLVTRDEAGAVFTNTINAVD